MSRLNSSENSFGVLDPEASCDFSSFDEAVYAALVGENFDTKFPTNPFQQPPRRVYDGMYNEVSSAGPSTQTADQGYSVYSADNSHYAGSHNNDDMGFSPVGRPMQQITHMSIGSLNTWVSDVPQFGAEHRNLKHFYLPTIEEQPHHSKKRKTNPTSRSIQNLRAMDIVWENDPSFASDAEGLKDLDIIYNKPVGINEAPDGTYGDPSVIMSPAIPYPMAETVPDSPSRIGSVDTSARISLPTDSRRRMPREADGYTCDECEERFDINSALTTHKRRKHLRHQQRRHHCLHPGCERAFQYPKDLERHKTSHMDQPPKFPCLEPGCTKGYSRKDNLKRHIRYFHSGEG
ncbi:hypothetical protein P152DRAFT_310360 [Eremomyces bilateralis CBS 781.70]|uniref:C2H2-type domain-containing protein n=1 Tax=Eremomyces bilateralis CBS 781.70 TaxID=1392243 RepID=A0A6G1G585_9PEZI|nr:uncharacterized protein P152DRAFT_310360 [Eremomyces bilateralis CBS 781.70]KAF1813223.1 hypothetical protein P152DRAFT_310360 [Eremomyces bilateralis CBS 781.70]